MKRIVLTGGGTAGHVTPHLALLPHLLKAGYDVHYIGTENGIEHEMIEKLDRVTYHAVKSGKLRRYHDWKNFTDPFRVIAGAFQSGKVIGAVSQKIFLIVQCGFKDAGMLTVSGIQPAVKRRTVKAFTLREGGKGD